MAKHLLRKENQIVWICCVLVGDIQKTKFDSISNTIDLKCQTLRLFKGSYQSYVYSNNLFNVLYLVLYRWGHFRVLLTF